VSTQNPAFELIQDCLLNYHAVSNITAGGMKEKEGRKGGDLEDKERGLDDMVWP
jgi:hypothetical protein